MPERIAEGLYRFDTGYLRPGHTACYIVINDDHTAIVDCGVTATAEPLLEALEKDGISLESIDWVVPTHVHLDHSGGAGALMAMLPQAKLGVHPSGKDHLVDPSRLETGVRALYGDAFFEREYAPVTAVPEERIVTFEDNTALPLGSVSLPIIHTPGHAWH
ncbi:MAG: MBL fold metallo-hydrolase, partial [Gammaproteobacteria bacterium]|nr:MBL fold metallo-hydrolase [Gammaproteobacteria bacterium]